jgi:hypothetical protein
LSVTESPCWVSAILGDDLSYAEINFEDGAANHIQALALVARLVS